MRCQFRSQIVCKCMWEAKRAFASAEISRTQIALTSASLTRTQLYALG